MIASRALWADGWKAVVEQPQGEPLTDEMLAAQTLGALPRRARTSPSARTSRTSTPRSSPSWSSAGGSRPEKYNVLPLDSRMQLRMGEAQARDAARDQPLRLLSGRRAAVRVHRGRTSRTARIRSRPPSTFRQAGAEGVLLAHGSWFAGYSLYVKDRQAGLRAQPSGTCRVPHPVRRAVARWQNRRRVPVHPHRRAPRPRRRCSWTGALSAKATFRTRCRR